MNKLLTVGVLLGCFAHGVWSDTKETADLCNRNIMNVTRETKQLKDHVAAAFVQLCANNLTTISSDSFYDFTNLDRLNLDHNPMLKFPEKRAFLKSNSLTELSCISCGVDHVYSQSLEKLPSLELINLTFNEISIIEPGSFGMNRKLETVVLVHNRLQNIPKEVFEVLKRLKSVDFSNNRKLAPVKNQPFLINDNLEILNCDSCGFSFIDKETFSELPRLVKLHLKDNQISLIHESSFNMQHSNFEVLNLQKNKITKLHYTLLIKTNDICLEGNPEEVLCYINNFNFKCSQNYQKVIDCPQTTTAEVTQTASTTTITSTVFSADVGSAVTISTVISFPTSTSKSTTLAPTQVVPTTLAAGLSISLYLTLIYLVQFTILAFLMCIWLKLKKFDVDPEVDQYAENITNPNPIYKAIY